jgi:membrane-bound lytic murein transglycosylase F
MRAARVAWLAIALAGMSAAEARAQASDRYDDLFRAYSKKFFGPAFDWRIFKAQAIAESGLDPNAESWVGARGLMQLMPATYKEVQSRNPELGDISDPRWNIAAGIYYDRQMWRQWTEMGDDTVHRRSFMFGSYNAGRGTLLRAQRVAEEKALAHNEWDSIETVAPEVPRWRYAETLGYVDKILAFVERLDEKGRLLRRPPARRPSPPQ